MPSTDRLPPSTLTQPAPEVDASIGPAAFVPTAVLCLMACALATAGSMAWLDGLDGGGVALAVLAVPAVLGFVMLIIDFAPWHAAQAVLPEHDDRTDEPPAFADTQASWRPPPLP